MYNLNELVFEAMLENWKQANNGNPVAKMAIDGISYEYNRGQYNDCLRHINDENYQIANIYNRVSQRGGLITQQELQELQRHFQLRSVYEAKSIKHFLSGSNDSQEILSRITRIIHK